MNSCSVRMAGCAIALALAAVGANADAIFKCTGNDGKTTYQSKPCGTGAQGGQMVSKDAAPNAANTSNAAEAPRHMPPGWTPGQDQSVTVSKGTRQSKPLVMVIPNAPPQKIPEGVDPMEAPITDNFRKSGFFTMANFEGKPAILHIVQIAKAFELPATLAQSAGIKCAPAAPAAGAQGANGNCQAKVHTLQIANYTFFDVDVAILPSIHIARMGKDVLERLKAGTQPDNRPLVAQHRVPPEQINRAPAQRSSLRLMGGAMQGSELHLANMVTTFAGTPSVNGSTDGTGRGAKFNWPFGIASDGTNLYVADFTNRMIRKIVIATGAVTTLAGRYNVIGSADGVGSAATFNFIQGITTDGTNLYVTDVGNHNIRKVVIATGAVSTLAGSTGNPGNADGFGTSASFNYPWAITTDGANLYVTDDNNATIRKIVIATGAVSTLAGKAGFIGHEDGIGSAATFYHPYGITTDGTNLYVADSYNNTIRKIVIATGAVSTLAGTWYKFGDTDGAGTQALFYRPSGLASDGTNLYVADNWNNSVRKIVIATGAVSTLAGVPMARGHADGEGLAASFTNPSGLTTDGTYLYVTDTSNGTIRKLQ